MRISDWSSDVCSSDLRSHLAFFQPRSGRQTAGVARVARLKKFTRKQRHEAWHTRRQRPRTGNVRGLLRRGIVTGARARGRTAGLRRSEEHTSELQSLMRISYAVFCLKKKKNTLIYVTR